MLIRSSSIFVANDGKPYRDVLVFINGVLQDLRNVTNISLNAGDNLTLAVQAVGNVAVINASDDRFICKTGFACNSATRTDVENRYLQCSLRTPANESDDGRVLRITLDNTQLINITINCKWKQLAHYGLLFYRRVFTCMCNFLLTRLYLCV